MQRQQTPATLVSADSRLVHLAQASAAAIGAPLNVVVEDAGLRAVWRTSSAVLIGSDQIGQVVRWALPPRDQIFLVGQPEAYETLCRWSMPLSASVIVLPEGGKWLSRIIAGRVRGVDAGMAVAVVGGVGGVGASTLAVSVAVLAARRNMAVALVDGDPAGGGIDLLLGAENTPGWRWDKLRGSAGQIADITAVLPRVEGVTMVSMERTGATPVPEPALEAVVDCLARSHDLVLIDAGRSVGAVPAVRRSVLVSGQTVRAIAGTRSSLQSMDVHGYGLVLRKGGSVSPADAARALELPLLGVLPSVPELPRLADRGVAPLLSGAWKKVCSQILQWCVDGPPTGKKS